MAEWIRFFTVLALALCSLFIAESNGVPAKPENLTVTKEIPSPDHGLIATLKWDMPAGNNKRYYYYVRYHLDGKLQHVQKRAKSTSARIFLKPNSLYDVKVMAFNASNTSVQGKWSDDLKVKTGDSVPTDAPVNVTATVETTNSVLVRWGPIPQESRNGKLLGYVVFYRQKNNRWKTKQLVNPLTFQYRLDGLPIGVPAYRIAVAGYTTVGVGKKSDAVDVRLPIPPTAAKRETTTHPSTTEVKEVTTAKYVHSLVPKPTNENKATTHKISSQPRQIDETITKTTVVSSRSPNAQANKDVQENTKSSGLVFKFIIPAAIGGLVMVILIICIMWRQKRKRKLNQGEEAIRLTPLSEQPKKKEKFVVTRGEGSIRYAPPPKTCNTSSPPTVEEANVQADSHELTQTDETQAQPTTISEVESSPQAETNNIKRPYAEVTIVVNDEKDDRYVKRNDHKPVPASPSKSTTSESGYENMQHLYECLDRIKNSKGSPLYMNVGSAVQSEEGLYEEIPADREDSDPAVQQPLLEKTTDEHVKPEHA